MTDYEELRQEVAALRAEVAALRGTSRHEDPDEPVSRRALFGKLAAVAAAGVGLAAVEAEPAAAATGTMVYGSSMNSVTEGTSLQSASGPQRTFDLTQTGTGDCLGVDITSTTSTASALWVRHNGLGYGVDAAILNSSDSNAAVLGTTNGTGPGVEGHGTPGVKGVDTDGGLAGVLGQTTDGEGVYGLANGYGRGVYGYSNLGDAVQGYSNGRYGVWAHGATAPLFLDPAATAGPPTGGAVSHAKGEVYVDSLGAQWVCIVSGAPGKWAKPGFNPIAPARLLNGDVPAGQFTAGQTKDILVAGFGLAPAPVSAVALTVSAKSNATGYVTLYPQGSTRPGVAQLVFAATNQWTSFAIVPISAGGKISVYNSAGATRIFLDVAGFFA